MYESFFGLREKAFNLTPDPDFLYLNERTKQAFEDILYGIERREGFAVVIGDVGTGKTTLCCALLERIEGRKNIFTVLIQNPMLSELDILRSILQDLGAGKKFGPAMTKKELIDCLNTFLAERAMENAFTVLIIDESQNLSIEMLEQLRLLSNLETTKKKLLQIIFLGQPEFEHKLAKLRQLEQRISVWFETKPLTRSETEKYIRHRLAVAGASRHRVQFGPKALDAIHERSRGYPRLINLICDRALREACRERSVTVTHDMIRRASQTIAGTRRASFRPRLTPLKAAAAVLLVAAAAASLLLLPGRLPDGSVNATESVLQAESSPEPEPLPAPQQQGPAVVSEPEPKRPASVEYFLQVHSFRNNEEAVENAKELKEMNLSSFVQHHAVEGDSGWYAVYVGPFEDAETARHVDSQIRMAIGASPVLRERPRKDRDVVP